MASNELEDKIESGELEPAKITPLMRICFHCKELKEFHPSSYSWCIDCHRKAHLIYRARNKEQWEQFFIDEYGEHPPCEICGKVLNVKSGVVGNKDTVRFDHRTDLNIIKSNPKQGMGPKNWAIRHRFIPKYVKIWRRHNFGILCSDCNFALRFKDRKAFLLKVWLYILKTEGFIGNNLCLNN